MVAAWGASWMRAGSQRRVSELRATLVSLRGRHRDILDGSHDRDLWPPPLRRAVRSSVPVAAKSLHLHLLVI